MSIPNTSRDIQMYTHKYIYHLVSGVYSFVVLILLMFVWDRVIDASDLVSLLFLMTLFLAAIIVAITQFYSGKTVRIHIDKEKFKILTEGNIEVLWNEVVSIKTKPVLEFTPMPRLRFHHYIVLIKTKNNRTFVFRVDRPTWRIFAQIKSSI